MVVDPRSIVLSYNLSLLTAQKKGLLQTEDMHELLMLEHQWPCCIFECGEGVVIISLRLRNGDCTPRFSIHNLWYLSTHLWSAYLDICCFRWEVVDETCVAVVSK